MNVARALALHKEQHKKRTEINVARALALPTPLLPCASLSAVFVDVDVDFLAAAVADVRRLFRNKKKLQIDREICERRVTENKK
jgi:hypothetical protein